MSFSGLTDLILPCLAITALLVALAWAVDRQSMFYGHSVDSEISSKRFHSIDGLRGFLAIGVMYHHAVITYFYYLTGNWTTPPSRISTLIGQGGVAMFFMVTALLFWHRALISDGRIDLQQFFWSRITRMVPMYVASVAALVVTALALTHFRLNDPPMQVVKDCFAWILFTFPGTPNINGLPAIANLPGVHYPIDVGGITSTELINTVYWSLTYEWKFYLVFPLMLFFARGWANLILISISAALINWYSKNNVEWYFVYGAIAATILKNFPEIRRFFLRSGWFDYNSRIGMVDF